ncbi:MAG: hypothetical protein K6C30_05545 [Bacteroidaceae bacterium]|nr:hypothetical protein [Bacteroidaceae bacterium]
MKKIYICPTMDSRELSTADGLLASISDTTVSGSNGGWVKGQSPTDTDEESDSPWNYQWEQ